MILLSLYIQVCYSKVSGFVLAFPVTLNTSVKLMKENIYNLITSKVYLVLLCTSIIAISALLLFSLPRKYWIHANYFHIFPDTLTNAKAVKHKYHVVYALLQCIKQTHLQYSQKPVILLFVTIILLVIDH